MSASIIRVILITAVFIHSGFLNSPAQGKIFQCVNSNGNPVRVVEVKELKTMSRAALDSADNSPVVLKNSKILSWIKEETRLYFFAHECAHHALGHTISERHNMDLEIEADCWAATKLVQEKILDAEQIRLVQREINAFGVIEWRIAPGPFRQIEIMECVESNLEKIIE